MDSSAKRKRILELLTEARRLEVELVVAEAGVDWRPRSYYLTYNVIAGAFIGLLAAMTSLVANVVGSNLVPPPASLPRDSLNLIRVYLTFPLGESALSIDNGVAIAIGCCLYLATGAILGIPFHLVVSRWFPRAGLGKRLVIVTVLAAGIWLINFYGILSWLQPLLFEGRWIVDLIPWWVALGTHLVFGWTMALAYPLGDFESTRPATPAKK